MNLSIRVVPGFRRCITLRMLQGSMFLELISKAAGPLSLLKSEVVLHCVNSETYTWVNTKNICGMGIKISKMMDYCDAILFLLNIHNTYVKLVQ